MKKFNWEEHIARIVMVVVGVVCIGLSIWYTRQFFIRDSELPAVIATLLSSAIAIFNAFALAASTFLLNRKKYLMAIIFIPIWLSTTAFDIFTVAGSQSYRFQLQNEATLIDAEVTNRTDLRFDLLQSDFDLVVQERQALTSERATLRTNRTTQISERDNLDAQIRTMRNERDSYESGTDQWNERNGRVTRLQTSLNEVQTRIRDTDTRLASIEEQLKNIEIRDADLRGQMQTEIATVEQTRTDALAAMPAKVSFANWLHRIFPFIEVQYIQFFLAIIPAVFIDLISPIAMSFGLTLAKETGLIQGAQEIIQPVVQPMRRKRRKKEEIEDPKIKDINFSKAVESVKKDLPRLFPDNISEAKPKTLEEIKQQEKETESTEIEPPEIPVVKQMNFQFNKPKKLDFYPENNSSFIAENGSYNIPEVKKETEWPITSEEKRIEYLPEKKEIKPEEKRERIITPSIHYRFGKTTEGIINRLIEFINLCIDGPGYFKMNPEDAAIQMKLSKRAKDVFINQLSSLRLGAKYLITKKNDEYFANYSAQEIINYATEIVC